MDEEEKTAIQAVSKDDLDEFAATNLPATRDIYIGSSLLLESDTTLRHYFKEYVTVDGYETYRKGNVYYIEYTGIAAHELGTDIVTTVKPASGDNFTITYNPLSYAYIALSQEGEGDIEDNLLTLIRAMYLYYDAAVNFYQE